MILSFPLICSFLIAQEEKFFIFTSTPEIHTLFFIFHTFLVVTFFIEAKYEAVEKTTTFLS